IESARRQIQRAAFLEFRMVHPESAQRVAEGIIDPGYEVLHEERTDKDGVKRLIPYLVKKEPERGLTGKYLKRAGVSRNPLTNEPEIHFELDAEGAKLFAEITREYSPREGREYQLAIVLDGELRSAPVIRSPIEGGRGQITGSFSVKEAFELASVLENPLEAPVQLVYENTVDPTLGKDSIQSGIRAAVVGTIGVSLFIAIYYLVGGIVANIAMLLNLLLLVGVMCMIGATFTLPGIAGIVLTVGMAVDANVLIFERIREELASGKPLRSALAAGYNKAFGTILDSNLTTLIASALLMKLGTGPIKGFGYTLTVGLVTSMFTALLVTRLIFDFLLAKNLIRSLPMLQLIRPTKIDFLRWAKPAFALSWIIILSGLGYGFYRGADVLSVEFAGGDNMSFAFTKKVEIEQLRQSISQLGLGDTVLQYQKDPGTGRETLRVVTRSLPGKNEDAAQKVEDALKTQFPDAGFQQLSLYKVGASVGREIQRSAIIATLLAMFGILLYVAFRYELSFSVGAIVAIVHDVLMTTGWYFLAGKELNGTTIAALLTIIGFSINDTIVIFDRVREDLKLGVRGTFKEILNHALNQCLSRTIITSGTVLMSTLALYLFGGGVINDFAFCLLVGIITGTYSTIYIASAIVLWWHKGERPKMAAQVQMEAAA
ncbi:MAG TPA: protein translocase subunit SecD, partial [Methylomirabilota bacterium]|nr:protein translocase subunit SecD [Methylomirabilota bacterium]